MTTPQSPSAPAPSFPDYAGKRVVVTGCNSGIGLATATALVQLGAEVHGLGRELPPIALSSARIFDLADPASIVSAVDGIGGRVDVLFNCAGAVPMLDPALIMNINFFGTRLLTDLVVEKMTSGGAIVNTSSDGGYGWRDHLALILELLEEKTFEGGAGWYDEPGSAVGHAYAFSKEVLNVWTMQQSAVLIQRGIRINATSPGAVQTPMLEAIEDAYGAGAISVTQHPSGRRSTVEEQAGPLLFLGSDSASYVNGADLKVDGGYSATLAITPTR